MCTFKERTVQKDKESDRTKKDRNRSKMKWSETSIDRRYWTYLNGEDKERLLIPSKKDAARQVIPNFLKEKYIITKVKNLYYKFKNTILSVLTEEQLRLIEELEAEIEKKELNIFEDIVDEVHSNYSAISNSIDLNMANDDNDLSASMQSYNPLSCLYLNLMKDLYSCRNATNRSSVPLVASSPDATFQRTEVRDLFKETYNAFNIHSGYIYGIPPIFCYPQMVDIRQALLHRVSRKVKSSIQFCNKVTVGRTLIEKGSDLINHGTKYTKKQYEEIWKNDTNASLAHSKTPICSVTNVLSTTNIRNEVDASKNNINLISTNMDQEFEIPIQIKQNEIFMPATGSISNRVIDKTEEIMNQSNSELNDQTKTENIGIADSYDNFVEPSAIRKTGVDEILENNCSNNSPAKFILTLTDSVNTEVNQVSKDFNDYVHTATLINLDKPGPSLKTCLTSSSVKNDNGKNKLNITLRSGVKTDGKKAPKEIKPLKLSGKNRIPPIDDDKMDVRRSICISSTGFKFNNSNASIRNKASYQFSRKLKPQKGSEHGISKAVETNSVPSITTFKDNTDIAFDAATITDGRKMYPQTSATTISDEIKTSNDWEDFTKNVGIDSILRVPCQNKATMPMVFDSSITSQKEAPKNSFDITEEKFILNVDACNNTDKTSLRSDCGELVSHDSATDKSIPIQPAKTDKAIDANQNSEAKITVDNAATTTTTTHTPSTISFQKRFDRIMKRQASIRRAAGKLTGNLKNRKFQTLGSNETNDQHIENLMNYFNLKNRLLWSTTKCKGAMPKVLKNLTEKYIADLMNNLMTKMYKSHLSRPNIASFDERERLRQEKEKRRNRRLELCKKQCENKLRPTTPTRNEIRYTFRDSYSSRLLNYEYPSKEDGSLAKGLFFSNSYCSTISQTSNLDRIDTPPSKQFSATHYSCDSFCTVNSEKHFNYNLGQILSSENTITGSKINLGKGNSSSERRCLKRPMHFDLPKKPKQNILNPPDANLKVKNTKNFKSKIPKLIPLDLKVSNLIRTKPSSAHEKRNNTDFDVINEPRSKSAPHSLINLTNGATKQKNILHDNFKKRYEKFSNDDKENYEEYINKILNQHKKFMKAKHRNINTPPKTYKPISQEHICDTIPEVSVDSQTSFTSEYINKMYNAIVLQSDEENSNSKEDRSSMYRETEMNVCSNNKKFSNQDHELIIRRHSNHSSYEIIAHLDKNKSTKNFNLEQLSQTNHKEMADDKEIVVCKLLKMYKVHESLDGNKFYSTTVLRLNKDLVKHAIRIC